MKVLHVLYERKTFGGTETYISLLDSAKRFHNEIVYAPSHYQYKESFLTFYLGFRDLVQRGLKNLDFDVLHVHFFIPAIFAQKQGISPLVCTSHCLLSKEFLFATKDHEGLPVEQANLWISSRLFDFYERRYFKKIPHVIAFSRFHESELLALGCSPSLMEIPLDVSSFEPNNEPNDFREKLGLSQAFTILFVGRPTYCKGLDVLLAAYDVLVKEFPEAQLLIIGSGVRRTEQGIEYTPCISWRRRSDSGKVFRSRGNIQVVNDVPREMIHQYYGAADVVVCPSLYESVGYVNLEAMASGRPVVASTTGGIPEFVRDGVNGLLFARGNSRDLASKILRLARNEEFRKQLGTNGTVLAQPHDIKKHVEHLSRIYEDLIQNT